MNTNNIILINDKIKMKIDERILASTRMPSYYILEFFEEVQYNINNYNIEPTFENIKEQAFEYASEFAYNQTPVYNYEIMEQFSNIDACDIDYYCENLGLEYNPRTTHFADFARMIVAENESEALFEDLCLIFEHCELMEFDNSDREKIKSDIINYLKNNRNTYIEQLSIAFKKERNVNIIKPIIEDIADLLYCNWRAEGYTGPAREWDIFKYYYELLYMDSDIIKAVLEY